MKTEQIVAIRNYAHDLFASDTTGHDTYHMRRVAHMAKQIAEEEQANCFICEVGGWLHDIGDPKLFPHPNKAIKQMSAFLHSIAFTQEEIDGIHKSIKHVSFSKGKVPTTFEGKIIQDADRLDAIGAIGIARTFAYGGANDQLIFTDQNPENTSIQHFHDKLLTLKAKMNTKTARNIAVERHCYIEKFLKQFYYEW